MEVLNSSMANPSGHTNQQVGGPIWNATQHTATADQIEQGVVDLPEELRQQVSRFLTFAELPGNEDLRIRSIAIVGQLMAAGAKPGDQVMLGGAPFFMEELSHSCRSVGLIPVFAFSRRESVEQVQEDGSIRKVAIFRHLGFVKPSQPQP